MVNRPAQSSAVSHVASTAVGNLIARINKGAYLTEVGGVGYPEIIINDPDFIASNIIAGKSIFGVAGTASVESMGGKKFASGTVESSLSYEDFIAVTGDVVRACAIRVSGLTFKPSIIIAFPQSPDASSCMIVYMSNSDGYGTEYVKIFPFNAGIVQTSNVNINVNKSPAYVISSGFKLPTYKGQREVHQWYAFG